MTRRAQMYMQANNLSSVKEIKSYEYISWIGKHMAEWKKMYDLPEHYVLTDAEQDQFDDWLEEKYGV